MATDDELAWVDEELTVARVDARRLEKAARDLKAARQSLHTERAKADRLARQLTKEERDVVRLEGGRLRGWLLDMAGTPGQRWREKERREAASAKFQHDAAQRVAAGLAEEVARLEAEVGGLGDPQARLVAAMVEKERRLTTVDDPLGRQLVEVAHRRASAEADLRELGEAIDVGHEVLRDLGELATSLRYASTVGVVDLLGGGLFITMVKHGYVDDARLVAALMQSKLLRFDRELADVATGAVPVGQVDLGPIVHFADFFLDGLIFDWIVQSKIQQARHTVDSTHAYVQQMVTWLEGRREQADAQVQATIEERTALLQQL
ncbi:MAG: hypothetical protein ACRD0K_03420 [Egibacteraceae bacterium]